MTVSLAHLRRCSVAVDLGASRTRVYLKHQGLVVDEPSVAAVNAHNGALIAVGSLAEKMTGRTPDHIRVVRPVQAGMVIDIEMAQRMLRHLLGGQLRKAWRRKPMLRAAVCTPNGSGPLAQRAAIETLYGLGSRRVELVDSVVAAAIGAGLPVDEPEATMIMLAGAGTTQIAVISMGSIVAAETIAVGGDAIDHAVVQHLRNKHELVLPSQSVRLLHEILSAPGPVAPSAEVQGRDVASGIARTVRVDTEAVRQAIRMPMATLVDGIGQVLRRCPPDLVADLTDRGIMLAGGAALLPGLDMMLRQSTGVPVTIADRPDVCAVLGLGAMMEGRPVSRLLDPVPA
ncbi:rod shape-determining protein [Streptomyces sp. ME01-24h]|nr:rod shape-determining protein [Streptomyces sp. ME19-03-3]MDX3357817.1 rod shape-determining protein [Streptomyces sp. ME01-24h]